jgi:amino acid permease
MYKNLILPASLLAGTIIGAGVFALPFVFVKAGIVTGLFYLMIFCLVFILIHLMYAEVIIKTNAEHRFPGYVKIYLGKYFFGLANLTSVLGLLLTLTIYLVLSLSFWQLILPLNFGISDIIKILIFWFLGSLAIFWEVRRIALSEFLITGGIILIILLLFIFGVFHWGKVITSPIFNFKNIFLPFGVVLFSLAGRVAISTVINYFQKIGQPLIKARRAIIFGTLIPALVYLLFIFGVLGLSAEVSEDAVSGLMGNVNSFILFLIGVFGLVSFWSSYIVIGLDVKNSLKYDLKFPKILAGLIVIFFPLFLFLAGWQNFLFLMGIVGGIFISLEGILISLMWLKTRPVKIDQPIFSKLSPIIVYFLILVFIVGIMYEIMY